MLIEKKKCQNRKKKTQKSASFLYSSNYCCVVHQIKNYQTKKNLPKHFFLLDRNFNLPKVFDFSDISDPI